MKYEGHAFHSDFPKGKASGEINVTAQGISFKNELSEVVLPSTGIKIEMGGAANRIIFITHKSETDWKLYTADHNLLQDPMLNRDLSSQVQIKKIQSSKRWLKILTLSILALAVFAIWALWLLKTPLVNTVADQVPIKWEQELGEAGYKSFTASKNVLQDDILSSELNHMAGILLKGIDDKRYDFQFHIIEDSSMNAAALPGGHVVIHSGLILSVNKAEDLLGVLAHEIAHVNQRHSIRTLIDKAGLFLVLQSFLGDITALGGVIAQGGTQLLALQNSRAHENEADEFGWEYLLKAKINPRGFIDCFTIMHEKTSHVMNEELEGKLSFLSTHPAMQERIAKLEKKWTMLKDKNSFIDLKVDFKKFQQRLRTVLQDKETDSESTTIKNNKESNP